MGPVGDLFVFDDVGVHAPDGSPILDGVSFRTPDRGITVVVGPSGAGKSTLLRVCNRLTVITRGRVLLRGTDVHDIDPLALRRRVGMVFQQPTMLGGTVRDNLLIGAPHADTDALVAALRQAALEPVLLDRAADTLSGGEAQRVSLARTLVAGPEVLLLDEPTSALDARPREAFEQVAVGLAHPAATTGPSTAGGPTGGGPAGGRPTSPEPTGMPILWVTHDLDQAQRMANHVVVLRDGRVAFSGAVDAFARSDARRTLAATDPGGAHTDDGAPHTDGGPRRADPTQDALATGEPGDRQEAERHAG